MQYNIAIATNLYISREKNWRNATSPIYNTQESPPFRRTTEKHDHSVDDDLFDLGLGCQMDYNGW